VSPRDEAVHRLAGEAWSFRCGVERDAQLRFARLAGRLASARFPSLLVRLAERASEDEGRHALRCAEEAGRRGVPPPPPLPRDAAPSEIASPGLGRSEAVLYEAVAACCVTETESTSVLTTLLEVAREPRLRAVLRELVRDEVHHARLGWACLAHAQGWNAFLAPLVPGMLAGAAPAGLFSPGEPTSEDPALLEHGVLPHALKREVFVRTLEEVIFPGLASLGVDPAPGEAWLERQRAGSTAS
jgi:hypothetical protein